ncbi:MAG: glycosyltransferase, partial [Candidatus Limnocylindria bacterium]
LEAMSMRCAVVVTAVGGIPELVQNNVNGILVPPHRPAELADRISELLADEERLGRLATGARLTVESRFSMRRMAADIETAYDRVLSTRLQ